MDPQRTDAGDALTTDQMDRQLRGDLAAVEAAAALHATHAARWDGNARRTDIGGPNGEGREAIIAAMHAAHRPELEAAATAAATAARAELGRLTSQVKGRLRDATYDPIRAQVDRVLERSGATMAAADRGTRALAGPAKTATGATKVPWPS